MTGLEVALTTGKAIGAVGSIARSSPWALKQIKRIVRRITRGYAVIPVFGAGGVGKSTAALIVAGGSPDNAYKKYEESLWTEVVALTGDIPGELKVAPGQRHRIASHWPQLFSELAKGKAIGLINVVAYGYHALEIRYAKEADQWQEGMSMIDFATAYTAAKRDLEVQLLEEVAAGLSAVTTKVWMATIINKQDLWSNHYSTVMHHYQNGSYSSVVDKIRSRLGEASFQHEYIPTSLAISNLTTKSGEIVAPITEGFDVDARNASLKELSDKLRYLVTQ